MAHYIIQTIAFQLFFLLIYDVFLKKETFFSWNRFYLIATAILSLVLPFIKIESFKSVVPQQYIVSLPEIVLGQTISNSNNAIVLDAVVINNTVNYWQMTFYLGVSMAAIIFLFKLIKILVLIFKNPKTNSGKLTLVKLINSNAAFSFFRYVFLGEFLKDDEKEAILKHEIIHVKQLHSIDLLFFELLRILFWFNPLVYMYQNRITTLHEFIADAEAVKYENKNKYYQSLLSQVFDTQKISFINPFFKQSLIKKRIVMLQKSKSKQIKLLKYALLIPMVFGMLVYTSCSENEEKHLTSEESIEDLVAKLKLKIDEKEKLTNEDNKALTQFMKLTMELYSTSPKWEKEFLRGNRSNQINFDANGMKEIPFSTIEQSPVFPECQELELMYQKQCMAKKISQFINENFDTKIGTDNNLGGRQRISVIFKIDTEGKVIDVNSRASHPALEAEAIRVVNTLPKMIPGKMNGENVVVKYSLPIIFEVENKK